MTTQNISPKISILHMLYCRYQQNICVDCEVRQIKTIVPAVFSSHTTRLSHLIHTIIDSRNERPTFIHLSQTIANIRLIHLFNYAKSYMSQKINRRTTIPYFFQGIMNNRAVSENKRHVYLNVFVNTQLNPYASESRSQAYKFVKTVNV